jgi:hypothetical protein
MSLARFSNTQEPYTDLANKIRHIYDLHLMLKNEEVAAFFKRPDFQSIGASKMGTRISNLFASQ